MRSAILILLAYPAIAAAQTSASPSRTEASGDKQDKVICKSFADVGSLIATHKECKTKREWDIERSENQRHLSECINSGASTGTHC